jgi:hypothetical protein
MGELADLAASTAFPGRVRQFAADDPGLALALAIGAAWCEQPRGGHAAAVVPAARRSDPLVRQGVELAGRLQLPNLQILVRADPDLPCEPLGAQERQPIRLPSLQRSLEPTWQVTSPRDALTTSAACEPLILLPGRDPRWGADRAALLALAWIAGDGRRVVWELPAGTDLGGWTSELEQIGRMQLALKLLIAPGDLPWPPAERGLARWWVAMPDAADAAGVLTWTLAGEECVLAALPSTMHRGQAWLPGSARRLADGTAGTLLCTAPPDDLPTGCGALLLTSLIPLPLAELRATAQPLVARSEDLARHLAPLAALDPGLRCTLASVPRDPH